MATQHLKELKNLSQNELTVRMRETEVQLFQARMKKVTGQLEDTATLWKLRKSIARIKTLHTQAVQKTQSLSTPSTKVER